MLKKRNSDCILRICFVLTYQRCLGNNRKLKHQHRIIRSFHYLGSISQPLLTTKKRLNMRIVSKYLAISVVMVFLSLPAFSQKVLSAILKRGEIRIGMTGTQPPFTMKSKTGELIGYEVDLAKALAKNMGVKLKLVEMPFSDLLGALKSGKVDAVMSGMTMTPERNLEVLFAGPYILSGKSILTKSKLIAEISAATTEKKYRIVTLKGSTSVEFVKNYMPKHELILVD